MLLMRNLDRTLGPIALYLMGYIVVLAGVI